MHTMANRNRNKAKKQSKFLKLMLSPFKILSKVANFYMKCMEECSRNVGQGAVGLCHGPQVTSFRSLNPFNNVPKGGDDREELLRTVSKRRDVSPGEPINGVVTGDTLGYGGVGVRGCGVGLGNLWRIDEEDSRCFEEDLVYNRSKSCAV